MVLVVYGHIDKGNLMKKIQNAFWGLFLLSCTMLMPKETIEYDKVEEAQLKTDDKSQDKRTTSFRLKIGAGPVVEEENIIQYLKFDKLLTIVKQAQQVINAKDDAARESAKKELTELMTKEKLDSLIEKVINKDIDIIQRMADKAALNKAYEHLCDIVLAIDAQKEFVREEGVKMFALYHDENRIIREPLVGGEAGKSGVHYVGFAPKKADIAKKSQALPKSQAFDLITIVQQAEHVLKAENNEARKDARLKLNSLIFDKRLHPAIKKVISEDVAILQGSGDVQSLSEAYERLHDIIELINSLKFVALNIKPKLAELLEAKIRVIIPQRIQDVAGKIPELLNKLEIPYRKSEDLIKKIVPQSIQNILDKPVDYIFGGDPRAKGEFYRTLWLSSVVLAAGSGIRAMFNKYKIMTNFPEWVKKIDKATALKTAAVQRAAQVYAEGRNPWEDDVWFERNEATLKAGDEANELGKLLRRAGVPVDVLDKVVEKYWKVYASDES